MTFFIIKSTKYYIKTMVNLFSYEKSDLISAQKILITLSHVRKVTSFKYIFYYPVPFLFCFTLEIEDVLFFLRIH